MAVKKKAARGGLGKGLDLLIPVEPAEKEEKDVVVLKTSMLEPNKEQPRKSFDSEKIDELAQSIKQYGIIQPIIVCKKDDYYQIIAGERRWRAAKKAGVKEVPVVVKEYSDREIAEISLIENIQREDLNPIEEALSYKQLIDDYHLTQEELAQRVSKSRTVITNAMRLLKLHKDVQKMLVDMEKHVDQMITRAERQKIDPSASQFHRPVDGSFEPPVQMRIGGLIPWKRVLVDL